MAYGNYKQFDNTSAPGGFSAFDSNEKTVPLGTGSVDNERTVIADPSPMTKVNPAVGWLVCTKGVDRGRSFRLVKGNNTIGRPGNGKQYGVELTDQSISRKGAAGMIVYNEKNNSFFITPGDLTININIYLNDEILLSPQKLEPRAVLEIAGDVLIFVPFCCDQFSWNFEIPEDYPKEEPPRRIEIEKKGIVRCKKGHYYNSDLHSSCPYCRDLEKNDPDGATKIF